MRTVKEILEQVDHLSKFDKEVDNTHSKDIPSVIILKRKAIRVFPDNQKIGLYYSQALDKYVSIPYGENNKALGIQIKEQEDQQVDHMDKKLVSESFRSKLKTIREEEQIEEMAPVVGALVRGAVRVAGPAIVRGARNLGKRALKYFQKKKDPTDVMKRIDKQPGRVSRAKNAIKQGAKRAGAVGAAVGAALAHGVKATSNMDSAKKQTSGDYSFGRQLGQVSTPNRSVQNPVNYQDVSNQRKLWGSQPQPGLQEASIESIKAIVESKQPTTLKIGDGEIHMTPRVAKKMVMVYESLNKTNKKKFEAMLNEDAVSFRKALNFAIKA